MPNPDALIDMIAEVATPEIAIQAIEEGVRSELGEVYKIDGPAILGWITKKKKAIQEEQDNARRMGFGGWS